VKNSVDAARAALHALGALPDDQRAAFEARIAESPALREEVAALRAVADELALAAEPVAPRAAVRERLLAQVAASDARAAAPASPALPDLLFALHADAAWITIAPGLEHRLLARDATSRSYLLRVAPGHSVPPHEHRRHEQSFLVSGSIDVAGTFCRAGDFHRAAAGTTHPSLHSAEGCVMLIVESAT